MLPPGAMSYGFKLEEWRDTFRGGRNRHSLQIPKASQMAQAEVLAAIERLVDDLRNAAAHAWCSIRASNT